MFNLNPKVTPPLFLSMENYSSLFLNYMKTFSKVNSHQSIASHLIVSLSIFKALPSNYISDTEIWRWCIIIHSLNYVIRFLFCDKSYAKTMLLVPLFFFCLWHLWQLFLWLSQLLSLPSFQFPSFKGAKSSDDQRQCQAWQECWGKAPAHFKALWADHAHKEVTAKLAKLTGLKKISRLQQKLAMLDPSFLQRFELQKRRRALCIL